MRQLSNKLLFITILATNLIATSGLSAANSTSGTTNPILTKSEDIKFHPAPGFPNRTP